MPDVITQAELIAENAQLRQKVQDQSVEIARLKRERELERRKREEPKPWPRPLGEWTDTFRKMQQESAAEHYRYRPSRLISW